MLAPFFTAIGWYLTLDYSSVDVFPFYLFCIPLLLIGFHSNDVLLLAFLQDDDDSFMMLVTTDEEH